jgi:hypothetical protein
VYWFWEFATKPLLQAYAPTRLVEVGAWTGRTTEQVLRFAHETGGELHVIDPAPRFDVDDFESRFPGAMRLHRGLSLDILPTLDPDAVLIDGDHNWYTVYNELRALERPERPYPLIILHDVSWPYARRDVYYAPDRIPDEFRQPCTRAGLRPGKSELDPAGPNSHLHHALHEGGPRNGVLTAIEDFMAEAAEPLRLARIQGGHGLGVLASESLLERHARLREQWDWLHSAEFLRQHCDRLEAAADRRRNAMFNVEQELRDARARIREFETHAAAPAAAGTHADPS